MKKYQNISGNSGVLAYELGKSWIKVQFVNDGTYLYSEKSAGSDKIKVMKKLAEEGRGLATFISTEVKDLFEAKLSG